jgi:molecular chaperone DnaK (HSP70)
MNDNLNIAIDFGTCNTVISYFKNNQINHINNSITGDVLIPTTLYFDELVINEEGVGNMINNKHYYIGSVANEQYNYSKNEKLYFYQFKRFLGITCDNNFLKNFDNEYTVDSDGIYFTILKDKSNLSIVDLIKYYFIGLKEMILETGIVNDVDGIVNAVDDKVNIVITVPAYFHDLQRLQFKKAVELAGFNILKIYNEPTAASIYAIYTYNCNNISTNGNGNNISTNGNNTSTNSNNTSTNGTNISNNGNGNNISNSTNIEGGDYNKFLVYDLGGGTVDTTVIEYHYNDNTCEIIDIDGNNALGGIDIDNILIENIYYKYNIDSTNIKNKKKVRHCAENIKIGLTYNENHFIILENIVLRNGTCKDILKVEYTRNVFNNLANDIINKMIEPIIKLTKLYQVNNVIFIGGPTQIPLLQEKVKFYTNDIFNYKDKDKLYKTIVADGACCNYKSKITLLDIIPMNIGIKGTNNMVVMLNKNSKIPTSCEKIFTTSHDCQRVIDIEIYEGVSDNCNENHLIGKYKLVGIPPLKKGAILINLLFKISINGILNVTINGFKNPYNEDNKNFDYKLCDNIKLISSYMAKELLKRILLSKNSL